LFKWNFLNKKGQTMKSRVFKFAPVVTGVLLGLVMSSGAALAKGDDDNLQKLGAFKTTGTAPMKTIEQNMFALRYILNF